MPPLNAAPFVRLPAVAACHNGPDPPETWSNPALLHHHRGHDQKHHDAEIANRAHHIRAQLGVAARDVDDNRTKLPRDFLYDELKELEKGQLLVPLAGGSN